MMKKVWLVLLAVVLVFGLVLGCGSSGKKKGGENEVDPGWTNDLTADGPITLELKGNFRYGDGYQLNFEPPELFKGEKVTKGDVYTLEISFTGDRDLLAEESFIGMGIVDRVTDYWNPLTWEKDGGKQEEIETRDLKTTGVTDLKITFTAIKTSPAKDPNYNSLNMQFKSPTDKAAVAAMSDTEKEAYNPHPLKLTVTKFIFTKEAKEVGGDGEEPEEPEEPGPGGEEEWPTPLLTFESFHPLGEFTNSNPGADTQRGWLFGEGGDDYTFTDNTWLLLETKGGNMNGFGGLQLTFIKDYAGDVGKLEKDLKGGWDGYTKGADEIIYWAIKLSAHTGYATFKAADSYTLYLGSYPWATLGFLNAYLVEENLNKIKTEDNKIYDLASGGVTYGFIATTKDDGIDWEPLFDTTFVAVTDLTYKGEKIGLTNVKIALNADITPSGATNDEIVWTTATTGATITGNMLTATTAGDVTVTATITNGTAVGTNFTKTFTNVIKVVATPAITDAAKTQFIPKTTDGDKAIGFGGLNGTLPIADYKAAKFLVFAFWGSNNVRENGETNTDGFGGLQVVIQYEKSDGSYPWLQSESKGWTNFTNTGAELVYVVVPVEELKDYSTVEATAAKVKFVLNSGFTNHLGTWLTSDSTISTTGMIDHTNGTTNGKFYITKTKPF